MTLPYDQGYYDTTEGSITATQQKTGLSANTNYQVRLMVRKDNTYSKKVDFYGTATAKGG